MCRGEIKTAVNILKSETIELNNKLSVTGKYFSTLEVIDHYWLVKGKLSHLTLVLKLDYFSIHYRKPTKMREGNVISSVVLSVCLSACSMGRFLSE